MAQASSPGSVKPRSTHEGDRLIRSSAKNMDLIEKKHQQIVDGACRLFFKKGYHGTTIREIAMASGMSMGQLYHYISSKDDVLFLIYKHMQMIWYDHLARSGIEQIRDPLKKLTLALHSTLQFMAENRKLFLFIYTETKYLNRMHLQVVLEMDDKNVVGLWRRLLMEVDRERLLDGDGEFLANLLSYLMVFLPLRGWNLKHKPTTETIDSLVKFVLKGLGIAP